MSLATCYVVKEGTYVHLHKLEHVVVGEHGVTEVLAVGLALEPHEPDALASGATVLLDHTRLESSEGLEALDELSLGVVSGGVRKTAGQVLDHHESVLGSELSLHRRR